MATVTCIPVKVAGIAAKGRDKEAKRRTAAYSRVSTDLTEQQNSFAAQMDYYERYIKSNPEWSFVGMYSDEGITGTNTKRRDGFNSMVADALAGKIDLIITKSISRFARNTVDSLVTVRKLKEKGVEVYFEKENVYTFDGKGELMITILSSLAQEESRSISENTTWGQRKRFADGKVSMPYKNFLGYKKGENGEPEIVEEEAKTVRMIYRLFLEGKTTTWIADYLTDEGILTPRKKKSWSASTVMSILRNEKYKGDALLQKTFVMDFLTKKTKINEGEVPQYYVEDSHPAIVTPEIHGMVQQEIEKRKNVNGYKTGVSIFSSKIMCDDCGGTFGNKVWHSNSKYRRTIWRCNHKYEKGDKCKTPHLYEEDIKAAFITEYNGIIENKDVLLTVLEESVTKLLDTQKSEDAVLHLQAELNGTAEIMRECVKENSQVSADQDEYNKKYDKLAERYEILKEELGKAQSELHEHREKRGRIERFIETIRLRDELLTEFDEGLWHSSVESARVGADGEIRFVFRGGVLG